jgi:hypothetical protein
MILPAGVTKVNAGALDAREAIKLAAAASHAGSGAIPNLPLGDFSSSWADQLPDITPALKAIKLRLGQIAFIFKGYSGRVWQARWRR